MDDGRVRNDREAGSSTIDHHSSIILKDEADAKAKDLDWNPNREAP